ncbi:hypothetical protein chiPu_0023591 [Chiloscyllium punctatum]|uniref:Uncharacterized protein n=1 Tax=Chiloscyllium punctatum TaxID=137246 RepID=A0A401TB97_CHIPU|nr:hypothetical protein [Chiloscyllium punctatum]
MPDVVSQTSLKRTMTSSKCLESLQTPDNSPKSACGLALDFMESFMVLSRHCFPVCSSVPGVDGDVNNRANGNTVGQMHLLQYGRHILGQTVVYTGKFEDPIVEREQSLQRVWFILEHGLYLCADPGLKKGSVHNHDPGILAVGALVF